MEEYKGFIFLKSFYDGALDLPTKAKRWDFVEAICRYAYYDEIPDFAGAEMACFRQIKAQIDKQRERSANGKKGGAPQGNRNAAKDKKTTIVESETTIVETKNKPLFKDKEKEKDIDKDIDILSGKPDDEYGPADQIIMYLNRSAGRAFQLTEKNRERVRTLLELYPEELICMTIDNMVAKWGPDPEMQWYLRPQTLFDPDKFESYMHVVPEGGAV